MPNNINIVDILMYAVIGLVFLGLLSGFVPQLQGKVQTGPALLYLFAGIAAIMAVVIVRIVAQGQAIDQKTMFAFILVFIIIVLSAVFLRKYLPEAFQSAAQSLFSMP